MNKILWSSKSVEWETPQYLFDELNREFHFTRDVAANDLNHKCEFYYTERDNGLEQAWKGNIWCNPPYSRRIGEWVEKAAFEIERECEVAVLLIPARTDTKWFHKWIYNRQNVEVRFIRGRLKFNGHTNTAPFPSMIVIFRRNNI